jgi:glycerol-3-phosphate dehydrogenase
MSAPASDIEDLLFSTPREAARADVHTADSAITQQTVDIAIVGAGVVGCAIARKLASMNRSGKLSICLLEASGDVAMGATKSNSGIIHGGFDARNGTLKSRLSHAGNAQFAQLEHELKFGFRRIGSLVLARGPREREILENLKRNGEANGVKGLVILNQEELRAVEPFVAPEADSALLCSDAGVCSPYEFAIALAENAVENGVDLRLLHQVVDIETVGREEGEFVAPQRHGPVENPPPPPDFDDGEEGYGETDQYRGAGAGAGAVQGNSEEESLPDALSFSSSSSPPLGDGDAIDAAPQTTPGGLPVRFCVKTRVLSPHGAGQIGGADFWANTVINAAGLKSDTVAAMVDAANFSISPRKGEYVLLGKSQAKFARHVIFPLPDPKRGKGILVSPTHHGNLLLGPTSRDANELNSDRRMSNMELLRHIVGSARRSVPGFDASEAITSYSGWRATSDRHDFIIEMSRVPGFVNVAGIESPGLTSSPAIAQMVVDDILRSDASTAGGIGRLLVTNPRFQPYRAPIIVPKDDDFDGVVGHPDPKKNIVCRCERVTESEIVASLRRPISFAPGTDGVKRRCRAGMGRCQGNFCEERVAAIIARERRIPLRDVGRRGPGSSILPRRRVTGAERDVLAKL